jgi:hypothetical protein
LCTNPLSSFNARFCFLVENESFAFPVEALPDAIDKDLVMSRLEERFLAAANGLEIV